MISTVLAGVITNTLPVDKIAIVITMKDVLFSHISHYAFHIYGVFGRWANKKKVNRNATLRKSNGKYGNIGIPLF